MTLRAAAAVRLGRAEAATGALTGGQDRNLATRELAPPTRMREHGWRCAMEIPARPLRVKERQAAEHADGTSGVVLHHDAPRHR